LTALIGGRRKGRKTHVGSFHRPPLVLCAESALSPSFSNNHPLSSFYTSYVDKSFIRTSFISFLFLHHRFGSTFFACSPITGPSSPSIPLPEFSDHPETPQLPLTGILTVSGLQRKSDKRYNRVCLFLQRHHSISCQVARLTLLVVHWSHPDSSTPLSNFCFFILLAVSKTASFCLPECLVS
jgi:hypothetical protein